MLCNKGFTSSVARMFVIIEDAPLVCFPPKAIAGQSFHCTILTAYATVYLQNLRRKRILCVSLAEP